MNHYSALANEECNFNRVSKCSLFPLSLADSENYILKIQSISNDNELE